MTPEEEQDIDKLWREVKVLKLSFWILIVGINVSSVLSIINAVRLWTRLSGQ